MQPQYGQPAPAPTPNYDFIVNPQQAPRKRMPIGGGSMLQRILIVGAGLIVLLIAFAIIKGIVSGGGNGSAMLHVVQDQEAITHITQKASQQQSISGINKNFATTTTLVVGSEQSQLVAYLSAQKQKIAVKDLNLKISGAIDTQLANAQASSTYNTTFQSIMQSQLTDYQTALKVAYSKTNGPKGRKLLTDAYNSARLLQLQLAAN